MMDRWIDGETERLGVYGGYHGPCRGSRDAGLRVGFSHSETHSHTIRIGGRMKRKQD